MFVYGIDERKWLSPSGVFDQNKETKVDSTIVFSTVSPIVSKESHDYIVYDFLPTYELLHIVAQKRYTKAFQKFEKEYPRYSQVVNIGRKYAVKFLVTYDNMLDLMGEQASDYHYIGGSMCWISAEDRSLFKIAGMMVYDVDAYRSAEIPIMEKYIANADSHLV